MTSLYKKFLTLFILFRLLSVPHGLEMGKFRPIRADIVLAIDTAVGDVGRSPGLLDVEVIQHFMRKITTAFPLSPEGSRMAVVEFATSARIRLTLSDGIDQKAIDGVYDELSDWYDDEGVDRNGPVDYYAMFRRINDDIFTGTNGDRPEIPNLLMVLTLVPSFENEDSNRWKLRARVAALGSMYNFTDPDGVVVTTSYASQTGTHHPKFTLTHGVGNFEPDAWHYQDFNNIMHYAVIHLRHAIRSAWVDRFYQEHEVRRVRTFDYTTCRLDPAIVFKVPKAEDYGLFVADIVFATEITRSAPLLHHDLLRTLVLNITRYLPISPNLIHFSAVEFDRESSNMRVVANTSPGSSSCCNLKSLFKSLIEKWAPQTSPRFRSLIQESARELISVEETGSARLNLRALSKTIQKTLSQSSRIPQIFFLAVIYPHSPSLTSLDAWFRAFRKSNFAASAGYFDAIIVTSGNVKGAPTYTVAVSPLVPSERLAWETSDFESVRGPLFEFVVNVTKAVIRRCGRCYYNSRHQCVVDDRMIWRNASEIVFHDGRYCKNSSGSESFCPKRACARECDRRPWSEWGPCFPPKVEKLIKGKGYQWRHRGRLDTKQNETKKNDTDPMFYRYCPSQKKRCLAKDTIVAIAIVPIVLALILG